MFLNIVYKKSLFGYFLIVFAGLLFTSCSKKDSPSPNEGETSKFSHSIYFEWADKGVLKIDLKSGKKSTVLPHNVRRHRWDISNDKKLILQVTDAPTSVSHFYDANVYTVTKSDGGENVAKFIDYHYEGLAGEAYLSPDKKKIAVASTNKVGITIFNLKGDVIGQIPVDERSEIAWMPDGTLIFTLKNGIVRTNKDFTDLSIVKEFQFNNWGNIAVSPDGKKIALFGGNHIWMMNSDGSNLKQVTESSSVEKHPVFSPDGKYLLIGTDYHQTGPFGYIWYIAIIPADGKTYNVDKEGDKQVLFIQDPDNKDKGQPASGKMLWK